MSDDGFPGAKAHERASYIAERCRTATGAAPTASDWAGEAVAVAVALIEQRNEAHAEIERLRALLRTAHNPTPLVGRDEAMRRLVAKHKGQCPCEVCNGETPEAPVKPDPEPVEPCDCHRWPGAVVQSDGHDVRCIWSRAANLNGPDDGDSDY